MSWINDYQRWLSESESLQNSQLVVNHFSKTDWTSHSLSAMLGNIRHESSVNPDMYEYGYDWLADRGYGLVQWTPRSKYWDWAVANNLEPRDGNSQLARIDYEVVNNIQWIATTSYPLSFSDFRENSGNWSVDYLTEAFTWCYERPNAQAGQDSMPDRKAFANLCFNSLDFQGSGSGELKPFFPTSIGLEISSPYGWRTHPISGETSFHSGIDWGGGGINHPIYATQRGEIISNHWSNSGGWVVHIKHLNDTYYSAYLHLDSQSPISVGSVVSRGQEIGTMGTTGSSTGIHLHFEIATISTGFYSESGTINPKIYLDMLFGGGGVVVKNKQTDLMHLLLSDALNGWKW